MKKLILAILFVCSIPCFSQQKDSTNLVVNEKYFGTSLLKVLKDFEEKYEFKLKYDPALIGDAKFDYLYLGTERELAFDIIFRDNAKLAYYVDKDGCYQIVLRKNLPKNRTLVENKKYEGVVTRKDLTITGRIKDITNGEPLPFATVAVEGTTNATTTNHDGYFTLYHVENDKETLVFKYLGYETQHFFLSPEINVDQVFVELVPAASTLDEVVIVKEREDVLKVPEKISVIQTTAAKIAELPAMGEKDIFRIFQLMPGIAGSNESSASMYVRGGTPDQNLILYDGFSIYHQEHLLGVFSAFNVNAVKDIELHKGGFDAKYGGRLSSVMEIVGKTGNDKQFNLGGDIGLLGFNAYMEIPFKEKGSFFVAGRRSFQSSLYDKFSDVYSENQSSSMGGRGMMRNQSRPKSYFYDLNAKLTYNPTKRDIVSVSFFNGEDDLDNSRDSFGSSKISGSITDKTNWGNIGSSVKWSRNWNERLYSNALVSFSNYYSLRNRENNQQSLGNAAVMFDQNTEEDNKLWDYSFKLDNEYKINTYSKLEFGLNYSYYDINYRYTKDDTTSIIDMKNKGSLLAGYAQYRWKPTEKITLLPGMRVSYYDVTSKVYPEPRMQFYYNHTDKLRFKASTGLYNQFSNRIVKEDISAGNRDIWLLSDNKTIPVSKAIHYIAGATYENRMFLFDVEAYYKNLKNITEFTLRFAPSLTNNSGYEEFFYVGNGYSRGIDFLAQKKYGKLTGWVGYTLSETRYKFPVYGDKYFSANQDVTHELKMALICKMVRDFTFSLTWIYATGRPYTQPIGGYTLSAPNGGNLSFLIVDGKNNARYPDYHRMDFSAKYDLSAIKNFKTSISLSLFNVYDRANVWYKDFSYDSSSGLVENNVNLLGFTPNITISFQLK
ncbi:MAG: TonB-dependent receptor [Dysgonomonas sp.]